MAQSPDLRAERGEAIARALGQVQRIADDAYKVKSQSGRGTYDVIEGELGWICSCLDFTHRGLKCKHVHAVEFSRGIRQTVAESVTIAPVQISGCPKCKSESIKRVGIRHNKRGDIQKLRCKDCGYWFTINLGFEKMKAEPKAITSAMQLYFTGESLRNTARFLRLQGVEVSHVTVSNWITKYVGLMQRYLDKLTPKVSDKWRADELYIKVRGDLKYLFAVMDDETRFWIAQEVSNVKEGANASRLFMEAKRVAGKSPLTLITDGLNSYKMAAELDFPQTTHIKEIAFAGRVHNNKMERMNGEVRDREKVMRGLKKKDTPILKGYQLFHNYIRPHEALNGQTPSDRAGIKVEGPDRWRTLIENASQLTKVNSEMNQRGMTET